MLTLNNYMAQALETAIYPNVGYNIAYPALKLTGEAGEVAEKVGKLMRDSGYLIGDNFADSHYAEHASAIALELGDVLWYVALLCHELGTDLESVARLNLTKLASRKARGALGGSGDGR